MGSVSTHVRTMRPNIPHATFLGPNAAAPTNTTAPTRVYSPSDHASSLNILYDLISLCFRAICFHFITCTGCTIRFWTRNRFEGEEET
jgi:hypothetical protein